MDEKSLQLFERRWKQKGKIERDQLERGDHWKAKEEDWRDQQKTWVISISKYFGYNFWKFKTGSDQKVFA